MASGGEGGGAFEDTSGEQNSGARVVEGDREGQNAPGGILLSCTGKSEQAAPGAIDIGLTGLSNGAQHIAPVPHEGRHLVEDAAAGKPVAGLTEILSGGVVAIEPYTVVVEDLHEDVGADREGDSGVEEIAGIDDDRRAEPFGFQRTEGREKILDGAVALKQVHILGTAEMTFEGGGEDDDGNMGTAAAKKTGDLGPELARAKMVVQNGDVDVVEELYGLLDGGSRHALVAVLSKDSRAKMQIRRFVIEQKNANVGEV